MRLSRAAGYALHALGFLARQKTPAPVSTRVIAAGTKIPDAFLLKALKPLVARRILESVTGPRGGYRLARPARQITLLEVIEAVEGPVVGSSAYRRPRDPFGIDKFIDQLLDEATRQTRQVLASATVAHLGRPRAAKRKKGRR